MGNASNQPTEAGHCADKACLEGKNWRAHADNCQTMYIPLPSEARRDRRRACRDRPSARQSAPSSALLPSARPAKSGIRAAVTGALGDHIALILVTCLARPSL